MDKSKADVNRTMKACILPSPAPISTLPLRFEEVTTPTPGDDDVLVRVHACGVCRTDLHVVEGELAVKKSPVIPGHQIVGEIAALGANVVNRTIGQRVGIAWLNHTCGVCRFCTTGRENLCELADFTGWTVNGGYAEYAVVPSGFAYDLPDNFSDLQAAPLLCAGIIGYRSLRLTGISKWAGAKLGLYGFGAAGHIVIQLARARGADVYVCTRDREKHQALATDLGAKWVGGTVDQPPVKLDASIIFAPAGEIVPEAIKALEKGCALVLGGIYMSPIPKLDYSLIYGERIVRSVANNIREDGREFLAEAARIPVDTHVEGFRLDQANEALNALKNDAIRGAAVLIINQR